MGEAMLLCEFLARVFSAAPDTTFVGSCRHGVGAALLTTLAENDAQFPAVQQMTDALAVPPAEDKVVEQLERVGPRARAQDPVVLAELATQVPRHGREHGRLIVNGQNRRAARFRARHPLGLVAGH